MLEHYFQLSLDVTSTGAIYHLRDCVVQHVGFLRMLVACQPSEVIHDIDMTFLVEKMSLTSLYSGDIMHVYTDIRLVFSFLSTGQLNDCNSNRLVVDELLKFVLDDSLPLDYPFDVLQVNLKQFWYAINSDLLDDSPTESLEAVLFGLQRKSPDYEKCISDGRRLDYLPYEIVHHRLRQLLQTQPAIKEAIDKGDLVLSGECLFLLLIGKTPSHVSLSLTPGSSGNLALIESLVKRCFFISIGRNQRFIILYSEEARWEISLCYYVTINQLLSVAKLDVFQMFYGSGGIRLSQLARLNLTYSATFWNPASYSIAQDKWLTLTNINGLAIYVPECYLNACYRDLAMMTMKVVHRIGSSIEGKSKTIAIDYGSYELELTDYATFAFQFHYCLLFYRQRVDFYKLAELFLLKPKKKGGINWNLSRQSEVMLEKIMNTDVAIDDVLAVSSYDLSNLARYHQEIVKWDPSVTLRSLLEGTWPVSENNAMQQLVTLASEAVIVIREKLVTACDLIWRLNVPGCHPDRIKCGLQPCLYSFQCSNRQPLSYKAWLSPSSTLPVLPWLIRKVGPYCYSINKAGQVISSQLLRLDLLEYGYSIYNPDQFISVAILHLHVGLNFKASSYLLRELCQLSRSGVYLCLIQRSSSLRLMLVSHDKRPIDQCCYRFDGQVNQLMDIPCPTEQTTVTREVLEAVGSSQKETPLTVSFCRLFLGAVKCNCQGYNVCLRENMLQFFSRG